MNKSQVQKIIKNQLFFGVNEIRTNNANIDKKIFGKKTNSAKTLFTSNNIDIQNDLFVHGNVDISGLLDISGLIVQNNASITDLLDTSGLSVSNNVSINNLLDTSGLSVSNNASISDLLDTSSLNIHNTIILDSSSTDISCNFYAPYKPFYILNGCVSPVLDISFNSLPDYNGQVINLSCITHGMGNTINIHYIDATTNSLAIPLINNTVSTSSSVNYKMIGVLYSSGSYNHYGWILS